MHKLFFGLVILSIIFILGCEEDVLTQTEEPAMKEIVIGEPDEDITEPVMKEIIIEEQTEKEESAPDTETGISLDELAKHDSSSDCWVVYEGKVYDLSNPPGHPSMAKTFFRHCGKESGFEEGAKGRHSGSNEGRVQNYATYVGDLLK
jgi:cytochrome b involved in lipid metabolism